MSDKNSYYSKIVRLVAAEKGVEHTNYWVSLDKLENRKAWYLKRNPAGVVPTMLVGPKGEPVIDSSVISKTIDDRFEGKRNLQGSFSDTSIKTRFDELMEKLDNF